MRKKIIGIALASSIALVSLAGCAPANKPTPIDNTDYHASANSWIVENIPDAEKLKIDIKDYGKNWIVENTPNAKVNDNNKDLEAVLKTISSAKISGYFPALGVKNLVYDTSDTKWIEKAWNEHGTTKGQNLSLDLLTGKPLTIGTLTSEKDMTIIEKDLKKAGFKVEVVDTKSQKLTLTDITKGLPEGDFFKNAAKVNPNYPAFYTQLQIKVGDNLVIIERNTMYNYVMVSQGSKFISDTTYVGTTIRIFNTKVK